MNKGALLLGVAAMAVVWPMISSAQVTIPRTRLRIVYQETGQPVEWVRLSISCWAKWRSKAEKKAYQEKIGGWEASKETTYGGGRFLHAEDGWITIPEVSNVRMDSYEIEIRPAAGYLFYRPKPGRASWGEGLGEPVGYFTEKTFPKFAALPEEERVLVSSFTAQCALVPGTLNPTYEEARYFLAAYKIILSHWPELSASKGCGYGGHGPDFKGEYYGFLRYHCLLNMESYIAPAAMARIGANIDNISEAERADLLERSRELFCNDIKAKQDRWHEERIPEDLLEMDFFQRLHCECMGVKGLKSCTPDVRAEMPKESVPGSCSGGSSTPASPRPGSPPPGGAQQKH